MKIILNIMLTFGLIFTLSSCSRTPEAGECKITVRYFNFVFNANADLIDNVWQQRPVSYAAYEYPRNMADPMVSESAKVSFIIGANDFFLEPGKKYVLYTNRYDKDYHDKGINKNLTHLGIITPQVLECTRGKVFDDAWDTYGSYSQAITTP